VIVDLLVRDNLLKGRVEEVFPSTPMSTTYIATHWINENAISWFLVNHGLLQIWGLLGEKERKTHINEEKIKKKQNKTIQCC
jgi:hypothetical protein